MRHARRNVHGVAWADIEHFIADANLPFTGDDVERLVVVVSLRRPEAARPVPARRHRRVVNPLAGFVLRVGIDYEDRFGPSAARRVRRPRWQAKRRARPHVEHPVADTHLPDARDNVNFLLVVMNLELAELGGEVLGDAQAEARRCRHLPSANQILAPAVRVFFPRDFRFVHTDSLPHSFCLRPENFLHRMGRARHRLAALPLFIQLRHLWNLGEAVGRLHHWGTSAAPEDWLRKQIEVMAAQPACTVFDASIAEVRLVRATLPEATLCFMHPVKTASAIAEAYAVHGVRTFSLDTHEELAKIVDATRGDDGEPATDLRLCVRLRVSSEYSELSLASKFGIDLADAAPLLQATRQVADCLGVCFHVGSQAVVPAALNASHSGRRKIL